MRPRLSAFEKLPGDFNVQPELSLGSPPWSVSEQPGCPGSGLASHQWVRLSLRFLVMPSSGGPHLVGLMQPHPALSPQGCLCLVPNTASTGAEPTPGATVQSARYHLQNQGHSDPTLVIINTWLSLCARTVLGTLHILHHLIFTTFNHLILTFNHLILTRSF